MAENDGISSRDGPVNKTSLICSKSSTMFNQHIMLRNVENPLSLPSVEIWNLNFLSHRVERSWSATANLNHGAQCLYRYCPIIRMPKPSTYEGEGTPKQKCGSRLCRVLPAHYPAQRRCRQKHPPSPVSAPTHEITIFHRIAKSEAEATKLTTGWHNSRQAQN